ncbi:MAG: GAF domain-containing protein [Candidatus Bipolaricaulia bacterium]
MTQGREQNHVRDLEQLFQSLQGEGNPGAERRIVEAKLSLVQTAATELAGSSRPSDDLIQAGYIGLLNAIYSFNPAQGVGFDDHATRLIREEIRRYLEGKPSDKFSEWIQMLSGKVRIVIGTFFEEYGRFPSVAELSNELNIKQAGVVEILKAGGPGEIDADKIQSKQLETLKLPIEDRVRIARAVEKVSKVQRTVIQGLLRIGKPQTQGQGRRRRDEREYLERLERELDYLRNFITAIDTDIDIQWVLNAVLEEAVGLIPKAEAGSVILWDAEEQVFTVKAAKGWDLQKLQQVRIPRDAAYQEGEYGGAPVIIDDFNQFSSHALDERNRAILEEVGRPKSTLSLPIEIDGQILGYLNIDSKTEHGAFSNEDLEVAKNAIQQISGAMRRAQMAQKFAEQRKRLSRTYLIGQNMAKILDMETLMGPVLQWLRESFSYDYSAIFLVEEDQLLVVKGAEGPEDQVIYDVNDSLELEKGIPGWVVRHGESALVNDVARDPRYLELCQGIHSVLAVPIEIDGEIVGVLSIESQKAGAFDSENQELLLSMAGQIGVEITNIRRRMEMEDWVIQTVTTLAKTIEKKDKHTEDHGHRMAEMTTKVGVAFGLSEEQIEQLRYAALLHDIGKIGVPDHMLGKEGGLTPKEWLEMKKHPSIGGEIISGIRRLEQVGRIVEEHQERWDGTGYPWGLAGEEISLEARILAVVDAYDVMTSDRPYRRALSQKEAIEELSKNAGTQFDNRVVETFLRVLGERQELEQARREDRERALSDSLLLIVEEIISSHKVEEILNWVAEAVAEHSPFQRVVISLYERPFDFTSAGERIRTSMIATAGLSETEEAELRRRRMPPETRKLIFNPAFKLGRSYYIPHDQVPWEVPYGAGGDEAREAGGWHPDDFLFIPMHVEEGIVGTISVDEPDDRMMPTRERLRIMEMLASLAALTVERAKREEKLNEQKERLKRIYHISQELAQIEDLDSLVNRMLKRLKENVDYDHGAIYLKQGAQLILKGHEDVEYMEPMFKVLKLGEGTIGWVAEHRESALIDDVTGDLRHLQDHPGIRSQLAVPIQMGEEILGVIDIESREIDAFGDEDLELLQSVAGQMAISISNLNRQEELREAAIRDPLTGLFNRRYFNETIAVEEERAKRYSHDISFLMIDVNQLKEINDRHGHLKGDEVLAQVADFLEIHTRDSDIVIRFGGDEFLVVMLETSVTEAKRSVVRLKQRLERWNNRERLPDLGFPITLGIGTATYSPGGEVKLEEVLKQADQRMYEDKLHSSSSKSLEGSS